ncbi:MAG TPA: DUF4173 domain-containing protein, partial [Anaerolineales bacterium]|nr:DUF4173 domain-containing protein [Anaerolineales bacterium]
TVLWVTVLVLGWCFDFLFWRQAAGLNFAIYVLLCLAGGWLVLGLNGLRPSRRALLLLIPILFFAAVTFIRLEPFTMALAFLLTLALMALLAASFLGGRWPEYSLTDYVVQAARLVGSLFAQPLIFLSEKKPPVQPDQAPRPRSGWKRFWAVLRGLLIALPVIAVFAALLSSADLVFAQRLNDLAGLFRLENLPQVLFRAFYILVVAYALAGVFLHAARKSQDEHLWNERSLVPQFLGFTEAAVVLGAVVALFAAFVIIQFRYFFGGQATLSVQGYTYSEYARRGFGELVAVAVCSLLLFLGLSAIARRQSPAQRWGFSGLGIAMVLLVGVILVSAYQRLLLYEAAYGFSRLRVYTHVFMVWLGLLLLAVVLLELLRRERLFPLAALLATLGLGATLALVNVDATIVRQNVARARLGQALDVTYLASLSTDSLPALAQAFDSPALPSNVHAAAGAALVCWQAIHWRAFNLGWRSFTLSDFLARQALQREKMKLKPYLLGPDDNEQMTVTSPSGSLFHCGSD